LEKEKWRYRKTIGRKIKTKNRDIEDAGDGTQEK
jgi:hypothetical protein